MKKYSIILIALLAYRNTLTAQSTNRFSKQIKARTEAMCKARIAGKYADYVNFKPLTIIKSQGDKDAIIRGLKRYDSLMKEENFHFVSVEIFEPGPLIDTGNTLQCLVPYSVEISTPSGNIHQHAYTLAMSWDKGKLWLLFEVNTKNINLVKILYPVLSSQIVPPEQFVD